MAGRGDRGRSRSRVVEAFDRLAFQIVPHNLFQFTNHIFVIWRNQGESVACALGASGAANAMDVGIGGVWHVKVDDM